MKAYSLSFKVVKSVLQNNEKCSSYDALNGHWYNKGTHIWEAIQSMGV